MRAAFLGQKLEFTARTVTGGMKEEFRMKLRTGSMVAFLFAAVSLPVGLAGEPDLYDTSVLRTFDIQFHDADWLPLLHASYPTETLIGADVTVDGVLYPNVGVRIRGNSSYFGLPPGSQKFSLKIKMDWMDENQELYGYDTINLNNAFHDPTFCREVAYNNFVAQFIPNPRASHAVVTLNGENWGVYVNTQQPDKTMLRSHFVDEDGLRIRCPNNPNGPGLRYVGESPALYMGGYEIQDDGGLADPWGGLIDVCDAVTNGPLGDWQAIDDIFAVDPSIWSVVFENMLTDDDSYVNKGADFMTYRDPLDGRTHLLQRDANETFSNSTWSVTRNFTAINKPVLSHVLSIPELRQRYMAHYRTVLPLLDWTYFEPIFTAHRELIDAAVQADPKKLYTYAQFQQNFTTTIVSPLPGLAGGPIVGLQQFVDSRSSFLAGALELITSGPTINSVTASDDTPDPADTVTITANVVPAGNPIAGVELFYRPTPFQGYDRVVMNGIGENNFRATLPPGSAGQRVAYYVAATADNAFGSMTFLPELTERDPLFVEYTFGATGGMRISEWMYSGDSGEFVEFTNMSDDPVDMTGWSYDDSNQEPGKFSLSAFGVVLPGESVVITESPAEDFRTAWNLDASVKIIGDLGVDTGHNLGRNDEINLYVPSFVLVDRLTYGDEAFEGSIRTQDISGQTCAGIIGQNDVYGWVLSKVGDEFGSFTAATGEIGTPGSYSAPACAANCNGPDFDEDGDVDLTDFGTFQLCFSGSGVDLEPGCECGDSDGDNDIDLVDFADFQLAYTGPGGA